MMNIQVIDLNRFVLAISMHFMKDPKQIRAYVTGSNAAKYIDFHNYQRLCQEV